jgi:Uma2 family endonuclease
MVTFRLAMTAAHTQESGLGMTLEDWAALPEDEPGELVDGRIEEEEVPDYVHELIIMWFGRVLGNWATSRGALVAGSGVKLAISARTGRMPDLTVYLPGAPRPPRRGVVRVPPSIALEVISPTPRDERRDRVVKLDEYAAFGVKWYWLVDPELRTFEVFRLGAAGNYEHVLGATGGVIETVPGCDGLQIDLAGLWAEIDALAEE